MASLFFLSSLTISWGHHLVLSKFQGKCDIFGVFHVSHLPESENWLILRTWASLIAQLAKNPPAMQETTPVRFLGREDPLEKA